MNSLEAKIHRLIEAEGPISIALYMALCLGDIEHGYYMREEAFGAKGDFITAPDISQLFGEIIGVKLALHLDHFKVEQAITLVELGAGRGALMADVLRTLKQLRPQHFAVLNVAMVETSAKLQAQQSAAIAHYKEPVFHNSIESLPKDTALLVIGNEFLDALPFHQYVKSGYNWRERLVTIDRGKLAFTLGITTLTAEELPVGALEIADGSVFEIAPARAAVCAQLAMLICAQGGAAILIDYGSIRSGFGDTFQAVRAHQFAPVLEAPGKADLTSHVDFEPLLTSVLNAGCHSELKTQSDFLLENGLLERAGAFGAGKSKAMQLEIQAAVERLAGPDAMGNLFKVLSFQAPISAVDATLAASV